jgi:2',3'-cyclic-nucleotide 2'-phosphodiesterase/3'-nucleotidase
MSEADKQYAYEHFSIRAQGMKRVVGPDYGYLYPSNLTFSFDPKKPPMQRIVKATLSDGNKLDMEKVYKVALNDFIAAGGDGFDNMKAYKDRQKTDILVRDSVINYIEELQIVKEKPEQRIFNLQLKEESQD